MEINLKIFETFSRTLFLLVNLIFMLLLSLIIPLKWVLGIFLGFNLVSCIILFIAVKNEYKKLENGIKEALKEQYGRRTKKEKKK